MHIDRYIPKPLDEELEEPARQFVPKKPLADALAEQSKPAPFDKKEAFSKGKDTFSECVHALPVGLTVGVDLAAGRDETAVALVESNPWRDCDLTRTEQPCKPTARVEVRFRNGKTDRAFCASDWAWGETLGSHTIVAWRFAEPQQ